MAALVIDASVSASWCFPDERSDYGNGVLRVVSSPVEALAPGLWGYEIRNCILMGFRRKRITSAHAEHFLQLLVSLPIRLEDPNSYDEVFRLAERTGLSVYDAAYLDLALQRNLPIATMDKSLAKAASEFGVPVFKL